MKNCSFLKQLILLFFFRMSHLNPKLFLHEKEKIVDKNHQFVDKRTISSSNPCTNRVWMCPEVGCQTPFWKVFSEIHYASSHPGVEIPKEVKMITSERTEVKKKKYIQGYQIIKLGKDQGKSKSKRSQRKSLL